VRLRASRALPLEIVGIVTRFVLAAEEMTVEFPMTITDIMTLNKLTLKRKFRTHLDIYSFYVDTLNGNFLKDGGLSYHIRFSFDRSGLSFSQRAIDVYLRDVSFHDQLFPTDLSLKSSINYHAIPREELIKRFTYLLPLTS
jgi:hypothetical protein